MMQRLLSSLLLTACLWGVVHLSQNSTPQPISFQQTATHASSV